MIDIQQYILLPKTDRQGHLDLMTPCINRGGDSRDFRGLLAEFLDTTIPSGIRSINLCHACHNSGCCNPKHLYWGTIQENIIDSYANGRATTKGRPSPLKGLSIKDRLPQIRKVICLCCKNQFEGRRNRKYCSKSCAAKINNTLKTKTPYTASVGKQSQVFETR